MDYEDRGQKYFIKTNSYHSLFVLEIPLKLRRLQFLLSNVMELTHFFFVIRFRFDILHHYSIFCPVNLEFPASRGMLRMIREKAYHSDNGAVKLLRLYAFITAASEQHRTLHSLFPTPSPPRESFLHRHPFTVLC